MQKTTCKGMGAQFPLRVSVSAYIPLSDHNIIFNKHSAVSRVRADSLPLSNVSGTANQILAVGLLGKERASSSPVQVRF